MTPRSLVFTASALGACFLPAAARAAETTGTHTQTRFLDAPPTWVIALLIVPAVVVAVGFVYRRENKEVAPRTRALLAALRMLAFFVLFLVLFRPVRETYVVEQEKSVVPILIDTSSSMRRTDAYADADVTARLANLAGFTGEVGVAAADRIDLVKAMLAREVTDPRRVLTAKNVVRWFGFGDELRSLDGPADAAADASYTRLGSAIADVLSETGSRGERVAEMIVISDGRNNAGLDPAEAATLASLENVRIHTVGVGDPNEPKNVEIKQLKAPDVALVNDDVAFEVVIGSKGYEGRTTTLTLTQKGSSVVLADQPVLLTGRGRDQTEVLYWRPIQDGEYDLEIKIDELPGEQFPDDNARAHHLRVDPEQINVLYVEGYPRWEYRFLMNILLRAKNVKAHCLLLDADKDFIQESSQGLSALTSFPPTKQELLKYDVVILGDVPPRGLMPTFEQSEQALKDLKEFVTLGGGLVCIAGMLDMPRSYVGTPIEDVLPVMLGDFDEEMRIVRDNGSRPFRPTLENSREPHEIARLEQDLDKNRQLWEDPIVGLPPQEWYWPVRKAKAGAEVILRHPENKNQFGAHVLLASTYYPAGRTVFVGFDSTWLWRKYYRDRYTEKFWRGLVRFAALNKLRRTNKRFDLLIDKALYDVNEPVQVSARALDPDFNPMREPSLAVQLLDPDGRQVAIELANVDQDEGRFEGTLRPNQDGVFQVWIEDPAGREPGRLSPRSFRVDFPRHEYENPVLARDVLESIAATTRGTYHGLDQLDRALAAVGGEVVEKRRGDPIRAELWSSWWTLLVFLGLLAAEWMLRKRTNLL
ncbi:MAG: VWA domain-containing protein [Planctomycetes bacterium]|nr:VWA domain-containing protein [Planctomycetota bacterium]MCC7171556.1 VWA domain-containing protein [Planctomycetota bacterium]